MTEKVDRDYQGCTFTPLTNKASVKSLKGGKDQIEAQKPRQLEEFLKDQTQHVEYKNIKT